jgi:hypothetical protein
MAQDGAGAGRQESCLGDAERGQVRMAHGIDRSEDPVEPPIAQPVIDLRHLESDGPQLRTGDHATLPAGDTSDRSINNYAHVPPRGTWA